jgi:YD repeat-containing protein
MGMKSTTIYDQNDLPIENYSSAPKEWYGASRRPLAAYTNQIPRSDSKYDEGINGLNVSWYDSKDKILFGSPRLHTTGIKATNSTAMGRNFANEGVPFSRAAGFPAFGFRATGKVTFPTTGTYTFNFYHSDGARLYIDNKLVVDYWADSATVRADTGTFVAVAGKSYDIRVDYYTLSSTSPGLSIGARLGSNPENGDWAAIGIQLKPDYNLQTSTKVYDNVLGDTVTSTNYGPNPELGLPASVSDDATGLNLSTSMAYEAVGSTNGFLRQTSKTMPGGNTYIYNHYGATEMVDNPCTVESDAVSQAGFQRGKTEPDPDLSGPLSGRPTETIYNKSGEVVASRYNNDPWTCNYYDVRGRTVRTEVPSIAGSPARTILNDYATGGNPLKSSSSDNFGTITTEIDLLGRTKTYKDTHDNTTTTSYDSFGRMSSRVSQLGLEEFVYDNLDRLINQKLDGVTFATSAYLSAMPETHSIV